MTFAAMTAATGGTIVGYPLKFATGYLATAADAIVFHNDPGVIPVAIFHMTNATDCATLHGFNYTTIRVNGANSSTVTTACTYNEGPVGITRPSSGYYVENNNSREIMYVVSDTTTDGGETGVMTVVRGCLGTTAAAIANDDYLGVLNMVRPSGTAAGADHVVSIAGYKRIVYFAYPREFKANLYKTQ
jgi:hypothetical protein